jgi:hypothetical protein
MSDSVLISEEKSSECSVQHTSTQDNQNDIRKSVEESVKQNREDSRRVELQDGNIMVTKQETFEAIKVSRETNEKFFEKVKPVQSGEETKRIPEKPARQKSEIKVNLGSVNSNEHEQSPGYNGETLHFHAEKPDVYNADHIAVLPSNKAAPSGENEERVRNVRSLRHQEAPVAEEIIVNKVEPVQEMANVVDLSEVGIKCILHALHSTVYMYYIT